MAKGGDNQKSNGSRFTKSYNASNSFVTKVASRVSDYFGGWFGTPLKSSNNAEGTDSAPTMAGMGTATTTTSTSGAFDNIEARRSTFLTHRVFDDVTGLSSPAKRFKMSEKDRIDVDFPISPIPSTSGLFQSGINHTFESGKREEFGITGSGSREMKFEDDGNAPGSSNLELKANGATDNHSDSSESTSGCSSLVPQSDRLSQSAYVCTNRKRNLEEKLKYARQLQQSRASLYLNRSIPVGSVSAPRKKPSFDVTAYGSPSLDKSLLREKLINSPFYTGQTSYGGASAYRLSRNTFYSQRNPRTLTERREGVPIQVKPSHHGSTEDLSNMSHTAKKILEALEQFSTPVNDAKRIPVTRSKVPLGMKRRRFDEASDARLRLSTPISPLNPNPNPGPVITGLNVPTVPDLIKLKRLERIQDSTAAARQVAVPKQQEYSLPSEGPREKKAPGKIVTKLKNKEKDVPLEKLEEVNLPKIPLPITTLPKFDFQLPPPTVTQTVEKKPEKQPEEKSQKDKKFVFSSPIPVVVKNLSEKPVQKNNFKFSNPLPTEGKTTEPSKAPLLNFMSSDAVAKLKRKSISETSPKASVAAVPSVPTELKTGSVMDFLKKNTEEISKPASETWECSSCLIRNINDSKICRGCKAKKVIENKPRTLPETKPPPTPSVGFGDKFKPPAGSWSCGECFVNNNAAAVKCIACESPKPGSTTQKTTTTAATTVAAVTAKEPAKSEPLKSPKPAQNGFGDLFKKKVNEWECTVCMIRNKDTDTKCAACETPKPGAKTEKSEKPFCFGTTPPTASAGGFKFGIDKAGTEEADSSTVQANGGKSEPAKPSQMNAISTSVGVFTFGIPPAQNKKEESKPEPPKPTTETSSTFLVSSTSGSNLQKEEPKPVTEKPGARKIDKEVEIFESGKMETVKTFTFGAPAKSPVKSVFGTSWLEKPSSEAPKPSGFFFGVNSNSALETVSSSTTDFNFKQDTKTTKPSSTFQFKPFAPSEPVKPVEKKTEPVAVTAAPQPFASSSVFETPKMTFGSSTTTSIGSGFGSGSLPTSNTTLFGASTSFNTPAFNPHTTVEAATSNSFGIMSQSTNKSSATTGMGFGNSSVSFTPFGSSAPSITPNPTPIPASNPTPTPAPAQNPEPPKPFGLFGANSSVPSFGSTSAPAAPSLTPAPAPAFGSGFIQPATTEKPPAPAPFIFGSTAPANTSTPAPTTTAPGVFTFGASEPQSKPSFSFGSNNTSNFSFGASAPPPSTNIFGGFGQPKPESSSPFGGAATNLFGQSSAPTPLESSAPKFRFGASPPQQQQQQPPQETTPVFQFGATPAQPVTAPAGAGFSLSVPPKFNFTGGQPTTFSATSDPEPSSERRQRKMIKAVRRTNRDPTRRP